MELYFFVNHILRRFLSKDVLKTSPNSLSMLFEDRSLYDENELEILKNIVNEKHPDDSRFITSREIFIELSKLIVLEKFTERASNSFLLYNELVHISDKINGRVKNDKGKVNIRHIKYLFTVFRHYFLENHPINLLNSLMKHQSFYIYEIKRFIQYPMFREWISIKSYIDNYKTAISIEVKTHKFDKTEFYRIYVMELHQSGLLLNINEHKSLRKNIGIL